MNSNVISYKTILVVFISLYSAVLVFKANFTLLDDHLWLDTIFLGKFLHWGYFPEQGRFAPFVLQGYNFISIICKKPTFFYMFNAFQIAVNAGILFLLLKGIIRNQLTVILVIVLLFIQPAFVGSYFKLQTSEKDSFFLFLLFIYCYFKLIQHDENKYLIIGLICANLALYFKETGFIPVGVLAFLNILLAWKESSTRKKIFDLGLLLSAITFLSLYAILILPHIETRYGIWVPGDKVQVTLKVLANFILSDPFLFLGLPLVLVYRLYRIILKRTPLNPLFDALIVAAFLYIMVFPVLRIVAYRYALPAYAFGIFPIAYYGRELIGSIKTRFGFLQLDRIVFLIFAILLLNSSFVGIHQITFWKNLSINHQQAIRFIGDELKKNNNHQKKRIFLKGANRANEVEIYISLGKYLHYQMGLDYSQFDLNSEDPPNNPLLYVVDPQSPFSVFQSSQTDQISKGDYVLIAPFSAIVPDEEYLKSLEKDYALLFRTHSRFYLKMDGLKYLLKYLSIRFDLIEISYKSLTRGVDYFFFKRIT